jgi:adenylate cyclase
MSDDTHKRRLDTLRERARRVDSQPTLLALAAQLRAKLPGDDRYGDTLSLAGREPHQLVGRGLSEIQSGRASLVNELGRTALQLWQAASEAQGRGRGNRHVALLFTDVVGFSDWALKAGDASAIELLRAVADSSGEAVREHEGRVVKHLGDGWMAVFSDVPAAVEAALDMRERLKQVEVDGHRPRLRGGVHCGRPRSIGGDYLGVDVNITARVAEAARPGEVLVSDVAAEALDSAQVSLGRPRRLKAQGVPRERRVVPVEGTQGPPARQDS